jgi:hypothetical protein
MASGRADPQIPQLGACGTSLGMTFWLGSSDEPVIMSLRELLRVAPVEAGCFLVGAGHGEDL